MQPQTMVYRKPAAKITKENYDKIKRYVTAYGATVTEKAGLCSRATAHRIKHSADYDSYLQMIATENFKAKQRQGLDSSTNNNVNNVNTNLTVHSGASINLEAYNEFTKSNNNNNNNKNVVLETDADRARAYNRTLVVSRHGIDGYKFVDENMITGIKKFPVRVGKHNVNAICSLARSGANYQDINRYLRSHGDIARSGIEQLMCALAYDKESLEEFKQAWKDGTAERAKNRKKMLANKYERSLEKRRKMAAEKLGITYEEYMKEINRVESKSASDNSGVKDTTEAKDVENEVELPEKAVEIATAVDTMLSNEVEVVKFNPFIEHFKSVAKDMLVFALGAQIMLVSLKLLGAIVSDWLSIALPIPVIVLAYTLVMMAIAGFYDLVNSMKGKNAKK